MTIPQVKLEGAKGRIIDAALKLAMERQWGRVSLRDIAERAEIGLVEMREHFSSKGEVLAAFARVVDDAVLAALPEPVADETKRDQLFEIVMARFDALAPYKAALRSISADASAELALIKALMSSQAWMLEAAGIGAGGLDGGVRVAGLAAVYVSVYRTWLADDDPGQARTMAALDRRLRRGERTIDALDGMARSVRDVGARLATIFSRAQTSRTESSGGNAEAQASDDAVHAASAGEAPRHA